MNLKDVLESNGTASARSSVADAIRAMHAEDPGSAVDSCMTRSGQLAMPVDEALGLMTERRFR